MEPGGRFCPPDSLNSFILPAHCYSPLFCAAMVEVWVTLGFDATDRTPVAAIVEVSVLPFEVGFEFLLALLMCMMLLAN